MDYSDQSAFSRSSARAVSLYHVTRPSTNDMPRSLTAGRTACDARDDERRSFVSVLRIQSVATPRACSTVHADNRLRISAVESCLAGLPFEEEVDPSETPPAAANNVKNRCSIDLAPGPRMAARHKKNCPDGSTRQIAAAFVGESWSSEGSGGDEKKMPCTAIKPYESEPGRCCVPLWYVKITITKEQVLITRVVRGPYYTCCTRWSWFKV
jgi:hypothetical protein